jgi:hypothetical protein
LKRVVSKYIFSFLISDLPLVGFIRYPYRNPAATSGQVGPKLRRVMRHVKMKCRANPSQMELVTAVASSAVRNVGVKTDMACHKGLSGDDCTRQGPAEAPTAESRRSWILSE